ncbi:MAG: 16S rRNA (guanine(527)-N(7))-methyltransferase RsmG [Hyphomicrobiaceae bacterium]
MTAAGEIKGPEQFRAAFAVSRETIEKFQAYEAMLRRWQKTINLVAPSTLDHIWHRHFADSAQLWGLRPTGAVNWLDLGSGAGFPGLVLAIMASEHGGTRHTLIESDSRKAAFIREVARAVGVAVDILCMRIEIPETQVKVREINCVTARALAPLPRLVELAYPYFGPSTVGLFSKGREAAAEIEQARQGWTFTAELNPSVTDPQGSVLLLKSLKRKESEVETEG